LDASRWIGSISRNFSITVGDPATHLVGAQGER
jgi:hypothetical protein